MRVKFENNTLTVVTEVAKEAVEDRTIFAKDDKGQDVFAVGFSKSGNGSLDSYGLIGNVTIEGKVAYVKVMPDETDLTKVKKMYGEALIAAANYTGLIAERAQEAADTLEEIFTAE